MSRRISVLMPVYNHERFVEASVESVAGQDVGDLELVVVDDGSTDGSADRVRAALDVHGGRFSRVLFERQSNQGIVPTLNRLVALATGDLLVPLASDDLLLPGGLRHRAAELDRDPSALAVFTDCTVIDDDGAQVYESGIRDLYGGDPAALASSRHLAASLMLRWCVPGPVFMARREAFDPRLGVGGYDPRLLFEDLNMYLRLAAARRLRFSPRPTAAYRLHGSNSIHVFRDVGRDQYEAALRLGIRHLRGSDRAVGTTVLRAHEVEHAPRLTPRRLFWRAALRAVKRYHAFRVEREVR